MEPSSDRGFHSMEHPDLTGQDSDGSGSSEDLIPPSYVVRPGPNFTDSFDNQSQIPSFTFSSSPPLSNSTGTVQWPNMPVSRPRGGSVGTLTTLEKMPPVERLSLSEHESRPQRPSGPARTPSNTYAPQRYPQQYAALSNGRQRSSSTKRSTRRDPNAQYRAQEKAYVQRIRAGPPNVWYHDPNEPQDMSVNGSDIDLDDPSPSSEALLDDDAYDQDIQLFLADDNQPTMGELKEPKNQERLEWHSMLTLVLKGDVVKQEKQRLFGSSTRSPESVLELWYGVRARACGRSIPLEQRYLEDARSRIGPWIEDVVNFVVHGEKEMGKSPMEQVEELSGKIDKFAFVFPTQKALEAAYPRVASAEYQSSEGAILAWQNITILVNTQLEVLRKWVGNVELDFVKPRVKTVNDDLADESSFLDIVMKEDGLRTFQSGHNMLNKIGGIIEKAKSTLIEYADAFAKRHLPPYIEELLTLINFPSRLIQEIIRVRLSYASKLKDSAQQSADLVDQMITQFQLLLTLAVEIKQKYLDITRPEPGWDLPPCIDENFENVVLDALKFYFRLLHWKLNANKNAFKEAEILESEWEFSTKMGRQLENGDVEVAEQFRSNSFPLSIAEG